MFKLSMLPPKENFDSIAILKQLLNTHKALAELKGFSDVIPNKNILINAAMINEAKNSSEIENIITTHDELYKAMSGAKETGPSKEVINYRRALWNGYELVKQNGFISTNMIITIQSIIENSDAGVRRVPGTVLMNDRTKEVVYTPPTSYDEIMQFMTNLENYINQDDEIDDLVKLAIIHYQFESIHPFYDGNGRTGRVINILYLVLKGLLDSPILYLSKYINKNKQQYYTFLQSVRNDNDWESLIVYLLKGIEETAINTLVVMKKIINLINDVKLGIKEKLPKIYSKELVDVIFHEFYTKISYVEDGLGVSRKTASTYLIELEKAGILVSEMVGRDKIYINHRLLELVKMADF
ncbi:MAG: Fic family protein [Candidatus Izemoplasmatales bacterium]